MQQAHMVGTLTVGNDYENLWRLEETGELFVDDSLQGAVYVSPIVIEEPAYFASAEAAESVRAALHADGVALTKTHLIEFNGGKAIYHPLADITQVDYSVDYDTDADMTDEVSYNLLTKNVPTVD